MGANFRPFWGRFGNTILTPLKAKTTSHFSKTALHFPKTTLLWSRFGYPIQGHFCPFWLVIWFMTCYLQHWSHEYYVITFLKTLSQWYMERYWSAYSLFCQPLFDASFPVRPNKPQNSGYFTHRMAPFFRGRDRSFWFTSILLKSSAVVSRVEQARCKWPDASHYILQILNIYCRTTLMCRLMNLKNLTEPVKSSAFAQSSSR